VDRASCVGVIRTGDRWGGVAHREIVLRVSDFQIRLWSAGDYPIVARHLRPIAVETVTAAGVARGDRVLDVATGDGNAAIECARRGASVVAIDLTPKQIVLAKERCAAEGVEVDLRVGNAMALEVEADSFDVVLSVLGVIFAPDPDVAIAELARAVRPGGVVALASWMLGGWSSAWRQCLAEVVPGAVGRSPTDDWGDAEIVARRLTACGLTAEVSRRPFSWTFRSVDVAIDVLSSASPPHVTALTKAAEAGVADELRVRFAAIVEEANEATDGSCSLPAPWLLAVATPSTP
jgi:2-polyprenyl-3-methyl-5-hydroxy-6-metoxy-1,4-benzoquinol methylase